jgi:hypothetical protein
MTKLLANLLQQDKNSFKKFIYDLESSTGHMQTDLKLLSEIKIRSNTKLKCLGLAPDNTKPEELYYSLLNLVSLHDQFLLKKFSSNDPQKSMIKHLSKIVGAHTKTVISHRALKIILHRIPPKKTMKVMKYRSLESMLKREDLELVVALSLQFEQNSWSREFMDLVARLEPKDFEDEKLKIVLLNDPRHRNISKSLHSLNKDSVIYSHLISRIYVLPFGDTYVSGALLLVWSLVIEALKHLVLANIFLETIRFENDFAKALVNIANGSHSTNMYLSKYELNWRVISKFRILNPDLNDDILSSSFEEEINNSYLDLDKHIYKLEPALHFWYETDYLGHFEEDEIVSLNILDSCLNLINKSSFKNRSIFFMSKSLEDRVYLSYLGLENIRPQINNQIIDISDSSSNLDMFSKGILYT